MRASARALLFASLPIAASVCLPVHAAQRNHLIGIQTPLILPGCPQFPALNGPGMLCEDFDTDRNGVPGFQFTRLPIAVDPNDPLRAIGDPNDDVLGYTQGAQASPLGTGGRVCSDGRGLGRRGCDGVVSEENDWHLHSPYEGPGAGYDPPDRPGIGAPDGGKAHSGFRSMHWGRHVNFYMPATGGGTDQRYRQIAAFVIDSQGDAGIPGLALGSDSHLEFWHIMKTQDDENSGLGFLPAGGTFGGGQVHISLLGADGKFSRWRPLSPTFNRYASGINSTVSICQFDPGDDSLPPDDDTMCRGTSMVWADLGSVIGTDPTCTIDTVGQDPAHKDCGRIASCAGGPGCTERGSLGTGVWAKSAFDLSPFAGRVARLRWIGSEGGGWSFGLSRSALEPEPGGFYQYYSMDDGWFLDDIRLTDLRQTPQPCGADADGDGFVACDTDCNDNEAAVFPGAPEICDGLANDCDAAAWPSLIGTGEVDADIDGVSVCGGDCDDGAPGAWKPPGEVREMVAGYDASSGTTTLSWYPPYAPGAAAVVYDLLRSPQPSDFFTSTTCVATGIAGSLSAKDLASDAVGISYYLVRARNACPGSLGQGPLGFDSNGVAHDGRACP